jgi:hypothetical protein
MKKKTVKKKLVLAKETLTSLGAVDLRGAAGGSVGGGASYGSCGRMFCEWQPDQASC